MLARRGLLAASPVVKCRVSPFVVRKQERRSEARPPMPQGQARLPEGTLYKYCCCRKLRLHGGGTGVFPQDRVDGRRGVLLSVRFSTGSGRFLPPRERLCSRGHRDGRPSVRPPPPRDEGRIGLARWVGRGRSGSRSAYASTPSTGPGSLRARSRFPLGPSRRSPEGHVRSRTATTSLSSGATPSGMLEIASSRSSSGPASRCSLQRRGGVACARWRPRLAASEGAPRHPEAPGGQEVVRVTRVRALR